MTDGKRADYRERASDVLRHLSWIWGLGFCVCLILLFAVTVAGTLGGGVRDVWSWFFPTTLPTLSLTLSATIAQGHRSSPKTIARFVARMSRGASLAYLLLVLTTIMVWPMTGRAAVEWFKISGLWLGPTQGLVGAVLAVFLIRQRDR